jgi:hypothetical protein
MADRSRFALAAIMLAVVIAIVAVAGARADAIAVQAKPVLLHSFDPSITRVGRLEYRGGLQLSSTDPRFGGLSGLLVSANGRYFTAISDRGYWIEAGLVYDRSGVLARIDEASVKQLRAPTANPSRDGREATRKVWRSSRAARALSSRSKCIPSCCCMRRRTVGRYP